MEVKIKKNNDIKGDIWISGSKNACLPLLACSLLTNKKVIINNVPNISDIVNMMNILKDLGVKVKWNIDEKQVILKRKNKIKKTMISKEVNKIRASYYIIPGMILNHRNITIGYSGGCNLGNRPIDQHLYLFRILGNTIITEEDKINIYKSHLKAEDINFTKSSVGACINAIMISVLIKGTTKIYNQVVDPEITSVINMLNNMGANITIIDDVIIVKGVKKLHGVTYTNISDRIEAGSYIYLGCLTNSSLTIHNVIHDHLTSVYNTLDKMKINYTISPKSITIYKSEIYPLDITTDVYPAFPTDLQQILSVVLLKAKGVSSIEEKIYPNRFSLVDEINKMGGKMELKSNKLIIKESILNGTTVFTKDLRGGFALIIASIISEGETIIKYFSIINRGYENVVKKLCSIGICIEYNKNLQ